MGVHEGVIADTEQKPQKANKRKPRERSHYVIPNAAGRPGGSPGRKARNSVELKDMVLDSIKQLGGKRYLMKQARDNPPAFLALVAKLLPKDVNVSGLENLTVNLIGPPPAQRPAIDVTPSPTPNEEGAGGALAPPRSE